MTIDASASITNTDQGMSLIGDVVFSTVAHLLEQGNQSIEEQIKSGNDDVFIIDCEAMTRIDSAGIALLLEWQRRCLECKSKCVFVALSTQSQALIKTYRLQSLIAA